MSINLKSELDAIFDNCAHYSQDALHTQKGTLYDPRLSELCDEFWEDVRGVLLKAEIKPDQADQFLTNFREELYQKNPYLNKLSQVRPVFEQAVHQAFPNAGL